MMFHLFAYVACGHESGSKNNPNMQCGGGGSAGGIGLLHDV